MTRISLRSTVAVAAIMAAFGGSHAMAADVSAPAVYDWSGFYLGGVIGYGNTSTDAHISYSDAPRAPVTPQNYLPPGNWVNGEFHGDVYNTLDSFYAYNSGSQGYDYGNDSMPEIAKWVTSLSDDAGTFAGTALAGYNYQVNNLIIGGELRATFGDFGNSSSWSATSGGTKTGYANYYEGPSSFSYTDFGTLLDPSNIAPNSSEGISYTGTYTQDAKLNAGTQFDYLISPVARLGFAVDRVQFFAMGGPSYANVKATTSATIAESLSGSTTTDFGNVTTDFTADKTYRFSGSNSEGLWGYTIGGGTEWAVTDNVILRLEGEYHNLGDITVKGTSAQTDATYKVKQSIDGYTISTGVVFKL